ncbi:MAG TPA: carbonic anhydrase family protein [Gemmatimonadaceae bacterium]|nr:carbonic anhydrase family protein [Gemmatimonadaceae bacterium]
MSRRRLALSLLALGAPVTLGAQLAAHPTAAHDTARVLPIAERHGDVHGSAAPHWSYLGEEGPARWGMLSRAWAVCGSGRRQSPVNVRAPRRAMAPADIAGEWVAGTARMTDNGHTIQVDVTRGGALRVGETSHQLLQFHFHTPSEHAIAGRRFPAEVHFVHRDAEGHLAVLGVPIVEGEPSDEWTALLGALPRRPGEAVTVPGLVDVTTLLNGTNLSGEVVYRYAGSLTTPPCGEGVAWLLRERPIRLSAGQLERLATAMGNNARPVQALNGRAVEY